MTTEGSSAPNVVVGVDGSTESIGALKWAVHYGHGQFTGMLAGSVSMHCVTHAACPVVVVRGDT